MELPIGRDYAYRPSYRTARKQAVDKFMGIDCWHERRGVGKTKVTRDFSADSAPQRVEHHCPLIIDQTCCIVPSLDVSVSRDVRPIVMAVRGKMQTFRVGAAEAPERCRKVKGYRSGKHSHRGLEMSFTR